MKNIILFALLSFSVVGCVSAPKGPQAFELKSPKAPSLSAYRSISLSREYEGEQMTREKSEAVDFIVESKPVDKPSGSDVEVIVTTVAKNGVIDLHDFAFPELNESIEFHYQKNGKVLKAGSFQRQSLFFVPPLPLPEAPVEKGDTWSLEHRWASASGIELQLNIIGIHKGFKSCPKEFSPCAVIEVSGSVEPAFERVVGLNIDSKISGELLFSLAQGEVYSSEVLSNEVLSFPNRKIISQSCMISVPAESKELKDVKFPRCEKVKPL